MASETSADDTAYVTALTRAHDLPRYYAALFAPPMIRNDLLAIYGIAAEIARVPDQVREPTLGEIRLKWWSDALAEAIGSGGGGETPALRAASGAINRLALPIAPFIALIEARSADLYADPPATLTDLEGRMGEMESVLFQMTAIVLGAAGSESADAAGHAGVAYGIARRVATLAADRARGRTILPALVLEPEAESSPTTVKAVSSMIGFAHDHLRRARAAISRVPPAARPAFLPLAIVAPLLRRIERMEADILLRPAVLSDLETLSRISWARLSGLADPEGRR